MMFNNHWFSEHQKQLLGYLNSPIGGLLRRGLWIPGTRPKIIKLTPNAVHVLLPNGKIRATLYSNKQYAQALHKNYKPLWEVLHWWDGRIANRLMPAWNAGFDSYDAGNPAEASANDTYIRSTSSTTNFGTNSFLRIGESNVTTDVDRTLIKFDFSSIPTGSVSSAASLNLVIESDEADNARTVDVFRVKQTWVEAEATWNNYSSGNAWQTAGATGANDKDSAASCSLSLTASETGTKSWTAWTFADLDAMFGTSPSYTNNGFLMKAQTETNDAYRYYSSGNGTSSNRPNMTITYAPGSLAGNSFAMSPYFVF